MTTSTNGEMPGSGQPPGFEGADRLVDARGLLCPEPLVRCRQAFRDLESGALVHVVATDAHAEIDFEVFARRTAHKLIRREWIEGEYHVLVRKA